MKSPTALSKSIMSDEVVGRSVFSDAFTTPFVFLKDSALKNNVDRMARFARDHSVSIAPHAKTAMAPSLFRRQLDAGAWALTAATISQVQVLYEFGVERILLANQLVDPAAIRWIGDRRLGKSGFEFLLFVDSRAGVRLLNEVGDGAPFDVLLEVGSPGARTGVRSQKEALEVGRAIQESDNVRLVGVAGYEGAVADRDRQIDLEGVSVYLKSIKKTSVFLSDQGLFDGLSEVLITAGGSMYFDCVVEVLGPPWSLPIPTRLVLRGGSYVTYDSGRYLTSSPFADRVEGYGRPDPALELWARVLSRPERTLALMDFGKRDVPFDDGFPVAETGRTFEGGALDVEGIVVRALNDHHAYLDVPATHPLEVGDMVGFGLHHPCTAFDKWRHIPIVDDDYVVIDLVATYF